MKIVMRRFFFALFFLFLFCFLLFAFEQDKKRIASSTRAIAIAEEFCRENGCSFATEKDTSLTLVLLFSRDDGSTLRVTVSFRRRSLPCEDVTRIDGILVYGISTLCRMKTNAYLQKERMRDLFDLSFIVSRYSDALSAEAFDYAAEAISYRGGSEQLEYIIATQRDSLIDKDEFAKIFNEAVRILGVASDTDQA